MPEPFTPCAACLVISPLAVWPAMKTMELPAGDHVMRIHLCLEHEEIAKRIVTHIQLVPVVRQVAKEEEDNEQADRD